MLRKHPGNRLGTLAGQQPQADLQRVEADVSRGLEFTDALDLDPVDLVHLSDQQLQELGVGHLHHDLVHRPAAASLQDLDADKVAADRADPGCHGAKCTGAVLQPDSHQVAGHGLRLPAQDYGRISVAPAAGAEVRSVIPPGRPARG